MVLKKCDCDVCLSVAVVGYCMVTRSPNSARRLGTASIVFSSLGILIVVILAIGLFAYAGFNIEKLTALISVSNVDLYHSLSARV